MRINASTFAIVLAICSANLGLSACKPVPTSENAVEEASFSSPRIAVETRGTGPDVILLPGLGAGPTVWSNLAARLEKTHRVHLIQIAGFAGMPADSSARTDIINGTAAEISRYITTRKLDKLVLIGHSMGGVIATKFAEDHSGQISKLMIVESFPYSGDIFASGHPERLPAIADQQAKMFSSTKDGAMPPALSKLLGGMVTNRVDRDRIMEDARKSDSAVLGEAMRELILADLRPGLARIVVPTEVVYVVPVGSGMTAAQTDASYRHAYAAVPAITLKRIDNSRHFIMLDQPDEFAAEVKAFLKR